MRCEFCKTATSAEKCTFAMVHETEGEKVHVFCCVRCAEASKKREE